MPPRVRPSRTLMLTLAYDGGAYAGWQSQPGQRTLQKTLEEALARITGETPRVTASGRTDAGVHALGQVVSFDTLGSLSPDGFRGALNAELPADMATLDAQEAPPGFHAIRDCIGKRYRYVIHDGDTRAVFGRDYCWQIYRRLDVERMHEAAQGLAGRHDFRSFESHWPQRESSVREIREISARRGVDERSDFLEIEIEADGFLYNMARAIAGTLVEVGRGRKSIEWPAEVARRQERRAAGMTAPAQGLFLVKAIYPADLGASVDRRWAEFLLESAASRESS